MQCEHHQACKDFESVAISDQNALEKEDCLLSYVDQ